MARIAALALVLFTVIAGDAQATHFRIVPMPGAGLDQLRLWEDEGAVGLLVPGAGPETSERIARASLVRGAVENSLRGGIPDNRPLVRLRPGRPVPPVIIVGIPEGGPQANDRRYPIVVIGHGFRGILVSESTRIPGLVSVADVAPTALGRSTGLRWQEQDDASAELLGLERRIDGHNDSRIPATLLALGLLAALALLAPRAAILGFGALLATNLLLGAAGVTSVWLVVLAAGLAVAVGGPLLASFVRTPTAVGIALTAVLGAYLVALALDGPSVALSPLGPTQNARFYGISNLLETLLLVPALGGAAYLAPRFGWAGFGLAAALALVAIGGDRFGADGGGAIVLAVGFALLATLLSEARARTLAAALGAAGLAVGALVALDAATGASSHVTRALEGGPGGLAGDLAERIALSYERTISDWYVTLVVTASATVLAILVLRLMRRDVPRPRRALPLALAAAVVTSLVVNDSPNDVALAGLVGFLAVERGMLRDRCAAALSSSPLRLSWLPAAVRRPSRPSPKP
jgi:hypothetical protein